MPALRSLLLVVLLFSGWLPASAEPLRLDSGRVEMGGHLALRTDSGKQLSIEEIVDPRQTDRFESLPDRLNFDNADAVAWLRFTVESTLASPAAAPSEWWLEVQPAMTEHITLYIPEPGGRYGVRQAGSSLPFAAREIAYRNPVFKLTLPAGVPQTYYLRLESKTRFQARLTFWQPGALIEAAGHEQIAFGLYLGAYLLLVLASLWFEMALRDRVYLYFAVYVSACILATLTSTGLWQQYILPDQPDWLPVARSFSATFLFASCFQFLFRFVEARQYWPRLAPAWLLALWLFSGMVFLSVLAGYQWLAMHLFWRSSLFAIVPSAVLILFRPALKSAREIRYAFVASGLFLTFSYGCVAMVGFHLIQPNFFTDNAMYFSSMAFFLIVYYAVSRRYYSMRLAAENAQSEALRISQRSEQELEMLVMARTDELLRAVQMVESALAHAQAVQQEQQHFITTVSHELRTPLAVIDATAQNLEREGRAASPKAQARLKKIRQATNRLSMLFDDYLNDERFEEFARGIDCHEVAVLPLLEDALEAAQSLTERHVLSIDSATPPLIIRADPKLLRLTLRTLTDNAVKYTSPGSSVVLRAEEVAAGWHIDVSDSGAGIPADEQKRVFERYYRGRASTTHIGTGLGLPLARRIVEMHGGTLELISPAVGGCTFRIWLPRYAQALPGKR